MHLHRKNGEAFWAEGSVRPMQVFDDPMLLTTIKDISVQMAAEQNRKASEERYRIAFETSQEGILLFRLRVLPDPEGQTP